jgi:predicted metal-dependent enzyme (double-stranded beta helix superfamily)
MFDIERLIAECDAAANDTGGALNVRELVAGAVSDPAAVIAALGEPSEPGLTFLYQSPRLTVINLVWGPGLMTNPHEHRMWAVIGMYSGREDNIFWRRIPEAEGSRVEAVGACSLLPRDCRAFGQDIVHSVINPLGRLTAALHIYGGDLARAERSEWDAEALRERPWDRAAAQAQLEVSRQAWMTRVGG